MTYAEISEMCRAQGLAILGGFALTPRQDKDLEGFQTLLMIGPDEPAFWSRFKASPEFTAQPDPLDQWSKRVLGALATELGGKAIFPSDGPPFAPFVQWALRSGRCHSSPINLLVHDTAGLFVSFRGALALREPVELPPPPPSPCLSCQDRPCLTTCPVTALTPQGYDVDACKAHITTDAGKQCMQGCKARLACPISQGFGRLAEQSEFHMRAFTG